MSTLARVARLWTGTEWVNDALMAIDDSGIRPARAGVAAGHLDGTVLPPLTDAHVHLGLASPGGGVLARVLDLGWHAGLLSTLDSWPTTEVVWAGPFLTAPGGYPSTRPWAPDGSVRELSSASAAAEVIDELHRIGVAVIKVTLNSNAGPVLTEEVLRAVVTTAHGHGLQVVAHVEGHGEPQRAAVAGVDCFAHAPWTHLLDDDLRPMVGRVSWISTLDMHGRGRYGEDYETALDNVRRFAALGGTVIYGTDLGNAITTTDLNLREVAALRSAGITGEGLLRALTGTGLLPTWSRTATLLPADVDEAHAAVEALPSSVPVNASTIKERLR